VTAVIYCTAVNDQCLTMLLGET